MDHRRVRTSFIICFSLSLWLSHIIEDRWEKESCPNSGVDISSGSVCRWGPTPPASSRVFRQSCWHGCHHRVSGENSLSSLFPPRHRTAKWIRAYIFIQYFKTSIVGYILWNSKHHLLGKMASTNINRAENRISQWAAEHDNWLLQLMWSCKFIVTHFHFHVN